MNITIDELKKAISKFLEYFLFEILDSTTIKTIEQQVGSCLKHVGVDKYDLRSTILDDHTLKLNLQFDDNNIDFMLGMVKY